MDASFALDGGSPSTFNYPWDTRCYEYSSGCYNTSVYNAQSLTYGAHILNITMLSYLGPGNTFGGANFSDFWFDYAVISTATSPPTIPSSAKLSSRGNTGSSNQQSQYVLLIPCSSKSLTSNSPRVAAAIGGAGGGILITFFTVLYYRKRRYQRQQPHAEVDLEPMESPFQPTTFVANPPLNQDALHDWSPTSLLPEETDLQNDNISPPPISPRSDTPSVPAHIPPPSLATENTQHILSNRLPRSADAEITAQTSITPNAVMASTTSALMSPHITEERSQLVQGAPTSPLTGDINLQNRDISSPPIPPKSDILSATAPVPTSSVAAADSLNSSLSPPPQPDTVTHTFTITSSAATATGSPASAHLTEEQSELVQGLLKQNIPLPAVVGVMEGMLRREGPSGGEASGSRIIQSDISLEEDNPPDYDFV